MQSTPWLDFSLSRAMKERIYKYTSIITSRVRDIHDAEFPYVVHIIMVLMVLISIAPLAYPTNAQAAEVLNDSLTDGASGATATRNVTFTSSGAVFDSNFDAIDYPATLFPAQGTIEFIIHGKPQPTGENFVLDTRGIGGRVAGDAAMLVQPSGQFKFAIDPTGGTNPDLLPHVISTTPLNTDAFHCLAVSYGSGGLKLYVDGVLESSLASVTTPLIRDPITVGDYLDSANNAFCGEIFHLRTSDVQDDVQLPSLIGCGGPGPKPLPACGSILDDSLTDGATGATATRNMSFTSSGAVFDTPVDAIDYPAILFAAQGTIEFVLHGKPHPTSENFILDTRGIEARLAGDAVMFIDPNGLIAFTIDPTGGTNPAFLPNVMSTTALNTDVFHCLAVSYGSGGLKLYVDGVLESSLPSVTAPLIRDTISLGDHFDTTFPNAGQAFCGEIFHIRTSDVQGDVQLPSLGLCGGPGPKPLPACGAVCSSDADCEDRNSCTDDMCNTVTGQCEHAAKPNGTGCDDGNPCTINDSCSGGACVVSSPVVCTALDACHNAGTCDRATGVCNNPPRPVGTSCDDNDVCTTGDTCTGIPCSGEGSVLWIGHDGNIFTKLSAVDGSLLQTLDIGGTGTAWNGTNLFFSSGDGLTHVRSSDALTELDSFSTAVYGRPTEDLTWDTVRQRLWRVDHYPPTLVRIDPTTKSVDASYPLTTSDADPGIVPRGALGVAYDPLRDVLYVSFCRAGCSSATIGEIIIVDPASGVETGTLFYTQGFMTGGVAYDSLTDTLWIGSNDSINHMTRGGLLIKNISNPATGFPDGVEYIPSCDAAQVQCVGNPVVCGAQDQCHDAGACNTATGVCSNPPKANGTVCSDASACTTMDTCQAGVCQGGPLPDVDGDAHVDALCGGDDCNDTNPLVWFTPVEVTHLTVNTSSAGDLTWDGQGSLVGPETTYDLVSGPLPGGPGFSFTSSTCLQPSGGTTYTDARPDPAVGTGYWYLVRARNSCGVGTYGSGQQDTSIPPCP